MTNLEIIIPTYNRAENLWLTCRALSQSLFKNCRIIILDNASTDKTPNIVQKYKNSLPNLVYIRNETNIGAELNYCKAVEISKGPYVWILGDDDHYCWEYNIGVSQDLLDAIIEKKVDLIMPRLTFGNNKLKGGFYKMDDLVKNKGILFELGFVPALIFKRELYHGIILYAATFLAKAKNLLPMMPFVRTCIVDNRSVYLSDVCTIDKGLKHGYSPLEAMESWIKVSWGNNLMKKEMFGWPQIISRVIGSIICDPKKGRAGRFKKLTKTKPILNFFWPFVFCPQKISRWLGLSQFDGNRT